MRGVFWRSSQQGVGDGDGGGRAWEKGKEGLRGIKEGSEVWGLLLTQAWQGDVPLKRGRKERGGRRGRIEQEALGHWARGWRAGPRAPRAEGSTTLTFPGTRPGQACSGPTWLPEPVTWSPFSARPPARGDLDAEPPSRAWALGGEAKVRGVLMSRAGLGEVSAERAVHVGREPRGGERLEPWASVSSDDTFSCKGTEERPSEVLLEPRELTLSSGNVGGVGEGAQTRKVGRTQPDPSRHPQNLEEGMCS